MTDKSKWQQELEALPEWAQKMVTALAGCVSYGGGGSNFKCAFRSSEDMNTFFDGFCDMRKLASALTAPWPPPPVPEREKRVLNVVELITDGEEDGGFDQKCAFGNRVSGHAVYCHNEAWPDSPRKCRRGEWLAQVYGGKPEEYRHEDCPGFVANPDYKERV